MPGLSLRGEGSNPFTARLALARISEDLMTSPEDRAAFVKDPQKWATERYGEAPSEADRDFLVDLGNMVAGGFCCQGCGCGNRLSGIEAINPALGRAETR